MSEFNSIRKESLHLAEQQLDIAKRKVERLSKTPEQHGHLMKKRPAATHPVYGESPAIDVCDSCGCLDGSEASANKCPKWGEDCLKKQSEWSLKQGWVEKQ